MIKNEIRTMYMWWDEAVGRGWQVVYRWTPEHTIRVIGFELVVTTMRDSGSCVSGVGKEPMPGIPPISLIWGYIRECSFEVVNVTGRTEVVMLPEGHYFEVEAGETVYFSSYADAEKTGLWNGSVILYYYYV